MKSITFWVPTYKHSSLNKGSSIQNVSLVLKGVGSDKDKLTLIFQKNKSLPDFPRFFPMVGNPITWIQINVSLIECSKL